MVAQGLVVAVMGAPRAGSTTLVRELGKALSDSFVAFPLGSCKPATWETMIRQVRSTPCSAYVHGCR